MFSQVASDFQMVSLCSGSSGKPYIDNENKSLVKYKMLTREIWTVSGKHRLSHILLGGDLGRKFESCI